MESQNNSRISVHTFTYIYTCSYADYIRLQKDLQSYLKKRQDRLYPTEWDIAESSIKIKALTTHFFRQEGINDITFERILNSSGEIRGHYIKFLVNPRRLLGYEENPFTELIDAERLIEVPGAIDRIIKKFCMDTQSVTRYGKFHRIDYCTNFWFQSQGEVEEYMKLLKKARIPKRFSLHKIYDPIQHRKKSGKYDITLHCKSYDLSIYLKQPQMISRKNDYKYPEDEICHAEGQLRIELRSSRRKLYHLKKSQNCTEDELLTMPDSRSLNTILKNLKHMYGAGDFYCYSEAQKIIKDSDYTKKVKDKMLDILFTVKTTRSLDSEKNGLDPDYLSKNMKYFNDLLLSPITIPKKCIHNFCPNPIRYIIGYTNDYLKL